jgi:hypothetical protein
MSGHKKVFTFKLAFEVPKEDGVAVVEKLIDSSTELSKVLIELCKPHAKPGQQWKLTYPHLTTTNRYSFVSVFVQPNQHQKLLIEINTEQDFWLFEVLTLRIKKLD